MWPDGICRVTDTRYTKTIQYQDINYQLSQNEDKTAIFEAWCDFLNYFDSSVQFQLSFVNLSASQETFARSISIPPCGDEFDGIRAEYAGMLQNQLARGNNGLIKTKYLTFGIEADNLRAAKPRLERIETDLLNNFKRLGVVAAPLNGFERLHVMHDILRMDEQEPFRFSWDWLAPSGLSTKDFIAPSSFEFKTGRMFRMGKKLGAISFVQILAPELNDRMLADFLDMESSVLVNLHVQSVDQVNAIKTVKRKITDLDKSKIEEQKKAVRAGYDMDIIPSDLATYGAEAKKLLQDLQSRNERMFLLTFLMGEFVPDFDDAISQAEIDEPPAHRPAVSIPIDGEWQDFHSVAAAEQAAYADFKAASHRDAQNFHITDDALGVGGAKAKFRANMAAIHLLQELEFEGLQASPEQQEILSRYVGWGGLADAFDENKPNWSDEFAELYASLSPEEYAAARASTLNAHYTSPTVIKAIYEAVGNMGFQTGNILEPSMGVGNFFGLLPEQMQGSKLYGVELDSITGRIAKQLYPKADITIAGFETTDRKDFYDLAVGNVPFGQYQVDDRAYNKLGFSIHDYFFAKTLDQVRPGGVIAFVTSRYTMDKQSPEVRRYIAQRAELLGAIRLPNNAFRANAGTDVVSDILFLQKRDRPIEIEPDWVHLGQNEDGFAINRYFVDHPEMILGRQTSESTQYGKQDFTVVPIEGLALADQLHDAVKNIRGTYQEAELPELGEGEQIDTSIPADPNVKNYSYTVVDGEVYYRENSRMVKPELNATAAERVKGMVALRDCVNELIALQMDEYSAASRIQEAQTELNRLYDAFSAKHGLINDRANRLAFSDDSSYYLLCSLEVLDDDGKLERKADMFHKRTIKQQRSVDSVDTASEALAVCIGEKACVDLDFMATLMLTNEIVLKVFSDYLNRDLSKHGVHYLRIILRATSCFSFNSGTDTVCFFHSSIEQVTALHRRHFVQPPVSSRSTS